MQNIMQGDAYDIPITITDANGEIIADTAVEKVEVMIGWIKKTYPGELKYSDNHWLFPVTQEDSFKLSGSQQSVQIRVKFPGGAVVGAKCKPVSINSSYSKEVL